MSAWLLIVACIGAGMLLAQRGFSREQTAGLNRYVLTIAVPALALDALPRLQLRADLLLVAATPWLVFLGSIALWSAMGRGLGWSRQRIGCLILVTGLGNTAFVGYPIASGLYGQPGLQVAVVVDQLGSFLAFSTVGIAVAARFGGGSTRRPNLLSFPPFVALLVALASQGVPVLHTILEAGSPIFHPVSRSLVPVALVAVGTQLSFRLHGLQTAPLALGLAYKLVLAPAAVALLLLPWAPWGLDHEVGILQCGMPPMVTAGILATEHRLEPELAAQLIGFGVPVALVTTFVLRMLLNP